MSATLIAGFARALQYVVPPLCLLGALVSYMRRRKRSQLVEAATVSPAMAAVASMSWREFELLVGEAFRGQGFKVKELGGSGADGGVDLKLHKAGEVFLVQCKHWKAQRVGVDVVRSLYGVMAAEGAAGGYVVTAGGFTSDAQAFASGRNIILVDGPLLRQMLDGAKPTAAMPERPGQKQPAGIPSCPACSSPMVRRTARRGANMGGEFWGCSRFPACESTL